MKRLFDIIFSILGLVALAPVFLVVAILIKLDSSGPVFFRQERMGRNFRPFRIYKFRTMVENAAQSGPAITAGDDVRITRIGSFLRRTKIDELPQLINVMRGEMSLVGPRPEVRQYVELFQNDFREILKVRPGITDTASLKYRNESILLGKVSNPSEEYVTRILPDKIKLAKKYINKYSVVFDVIVILRSLRNLFARSTY